MLEARTRPAREGFSLIIALAASALMVSTVVVVASFISIETRLAAYSQLGIRARLNATAALKLALAHLQQEAGPDRRATARAEIIQPDATVPTLRNPMWTGVWRTDRPDQPPAWLISGRHDQPTGAQSASLEGHSDYGPGHLHPLEPAYPPVGVETVTLVGEGSANRFSAADPTKPDGIVEGLPKLPLPESPGSFAYWIGDEGIKARINLADPRLGAATGSAEHLAALRSPGRAATELLSGLGSSDQTELSRTNGAHELTLLTGFAPGSPTGLSARATAPDSRRLFHDVSFSSAGVLADSRDGGLRRDLSLAFELSDQEFSKSEFGSAFDLPATGTATGQETVRMRVPFAGKIIQVAPVFNRTTQQGELRGPTWWALRDYHRLYKQLGWNAAGVPVLRARSLFPNAGSIHRAPSAADSESLRKSHYLYAGAHNGSHPRLNPSVQDFGTLFGEPDLPIPRPFACSAAPYLDRAMLVFDISQGGGLITLNLTPFVVLHNPYNVAMECPATSDGASHVFSFSDWDAWKLILRVKRNGATYSYEHPLGDYYRRMAEDGSGAPDILAMHLGSVTLQPGEHRVYSPESTGRATWGRMMRLTNGFNYTGGCTDGGLDWSELWPGFTLQAKDSMEFEIAPAGRTSPDSKGLPSSVPAANRVTPGGVFRFRHGLVCWPGDALTETGAGPEIYFRSSELNEITHRVVDSAVVGHPGPFIFPDHSFIPYNRTSTGLAAPGQIIAAIELSTRSVTERTPDATWLSTEPTRARNYPPYTAEPRLYRPAPPVPTFTHTNPTAPVTRADGAGRSANGEGAGLNGSSPSFRMRSFRPNGSGSEAWSTLIPTQVSGGDTFAFGGHSKETTGSTRTVHVEIPLAPPTCLGQYAHANFGLRDQQPLYGVGNSFASLQVSMEKAHELTAPDWTDFDQPYLLNASLWDAYFLSSAAPQMTRRAAPADPVPPAPGSDAAHPLFETRTLTQVLDDFAEGKAGLLNPRMRLAVDGAVARRALSSHRTSAGVLLNQGAFNVNSTSIDAWTAFLGSANRQAYSRFGANQPNAGEVNRANVRMPRALRTDPSEPVKDAGKPEERTDNWAGFANLNEVQIRALARAIVAENKARFQIIRRTERDPRGPPARRIFAGQTAASTPYLSLSEFVNRFLCTEAWAGRCGALQSAIFRADAVEGTKLSDRDDAAGGTTSKVMVTQASLSGANAPPFLQPQNVEAFERPASGAGSSRVHAAMGSPGTLIQVDLLQSLGCSIATRSDTFTIRAYAEARDGMGSFARTWVEAVVQRMPGHLSAENPPETRPDDPALSPVNRLLGRRFIILSARWLRQDEI